MWIVVYVTQSEEEAHALASRFTKNGIISRIRKTGGGGCFEVLVPQSELSEAQDLIFELE
ncbi:MAG: hypothetical protein PUF72_11430 [Clostridiales bacterium]|nr:hypothetical protein [Clostridiales bacterium]